jgi:hypothetical protein
VGRRASVGSARFICAMAEVPLKRRGILVAQTRFKYSCAYVFFRCFGKTISDLGPEGTASDVPVTRRVS